VTPESGGIDPLPFQKGATGAWVPFHNGIIRTVISCLINIDLKQTYCSRSRTHKIQYMLFFCCWKETSTIGNGFFVFYKFPLPSTLLSPSCPTAVPVSPPENISLRWTDLRWCKDTNFVSPASSLPRRRDALALSGPCRHSASWLPLGREDALLCGARTGRRRARPSCPGDRPSSTKKQTKS